MLGKNKSGEIYMKDDSQNRIMLRDGREDDKQKNQQEREKLQSYKEHIKRKENHDCEPTKRCYTEKW